MRVLIPLLLVWSGTCGADAQSSPAGRLARFEAAFERTGEFEQCVSLVRIHSAEVLDDRHILFRLGLRNYYLNTLPQRCPDLRVADGFSYRTSLSVLCNVDVIAPLGLTGPSALAGPRCGLGTFEKVEKVRRGQPAG